MYGFKYLPLFCSLVTAQLQPRWVYFDSDGISIAAHLYVPPSNSTSNASRPAIVVGHPHGSVKEQSSGQYTREITERTGFVTLVFNATYQGESSSLPRYLEDPYQRANDVRNTVTYLATLDIVNATRIGTLGVCISGGYMPFTAQTNKRIRAVATVNSINLGTLYSKEFGNYSGPMQSSLQDKLIETGQQRIREIKEAQPNLTRIFPQTAADIIPDLPVFYQESYDYYQTPRGHV